MWMRWLPWRYIVSRAARAGGFIDPITLMARLSRFAQPSEVGEPIELLRAGVVFHARGLVNRAIQHNLDWVWPYWVERQFDPNDESFMPRAFSVTHVNLTHRNWTAVGIPDADYLPIVDPCGLVTPVLDGWSLDGWLIGEDGTALFPSQRLDAAQRLELSDEHGIAIVTETAAEGLKLETRAWVESRDQRATCLMRVTARTDRDAWLVVALRPYNPEGVSFIHEVSLLGERIWRVGDTTVDLGEVPERHALSTYHVGDVKAELPNGDKRTSVTCDVGMATGAALFAVNGSRTVTVSVPLEPGPNGDVHRRAARPTWREALAGHCTLAVAEPRAQFIYDAAVRSLVLHSPEDVYPGPYTYKRFWFRDAAFIIDGLLALGMFSRAERVLRRFPERQSHDGYFLSQAGEWDSNGEALWAMHRYCRVAGIETPPEWREPVRKAGLWIEDKRLSDRLEEPHAGLLPAGFSAEHLGPNDYYYWDDFWCIAGLESAAAMLSPNEQRLAARFRRTAELLGAAIERSLDVTRDRRRGMGIPASPYRRLDAGAIGSLAASYPLRLWDEADPRLLATVEWFLTHCWVRGGFFQDMIHSGINPYLTIHVAQVLLRAGDPRFADALRATLALASPTGQWPEAVHPRTLGGCMGDGQHVWAAAELVMMVRACFVREEADRLVLASGVLPEWIGDGPARFGETPTPHGPIAVEVRRTHGAHEVSWTARWRGAPPRIEVRLPGRAPVFADGAAGRVVLEGTP
jgi:hypothetical protein